MNIEALKDISLSGDLAARSIKNFARLHDRHYLPEVICTSAAECPGWPGDWEGRTILALTLMAQNVKTEPAYLEEVMQKTFDSFNAAGYRGEVLDLDSINEQQLSGHGWLLRGLVEYYRWKGDKRIRGIIENIIDKLFLPLSGKFGTYPVHKDDRVYEGNAAGDLSGKTVNHWCISTDTGCAFISLDGLSQVYEEFKNPALGSLINEMIEAFLKIDFTGITMQTHATLTATRGIMRLYELNREPKLLQEVVRIFELYKSQGMTDNYANFNWFCRPSWTEPCGIIDSYIIALSLWKNTGVPGYLNDAHNIWYNGVLRGQRPNGGFGCDKCVEDQTLSGHEYFEAHWCCTMRGAEGLSTPSLFSALTGDNQLTIPVYLDGTIRLNGNFKATLREKSSYPEAGRIQFEVMEGDDTRISFLMYRPVWAKNISVALNGTPIPFKITNGFVDIHVPLTKGTTIEMTFDIPLYMADTDGYIHKGSGYKTIRHGTLLLGADDKNFPDMVSLKEFESLGGSSYRAYGTVLQPIHKTYLLEEKQAREAEYRILFKTLE